MLDVEVLEVRVLLEDVLVLLVEVRDVEVLEAGRKRHVILTWFIMISSSSCQMMNLLKLIVGTFPLAPTIIRLVLGLP